MSFSIFWTSEAKSSFNQITEYLEKKWSYQIADNFIDRVIVPQVSLYYRTKSEHVELIISWDNRQDPEKFSL